MLLAKMEKEVKDSLDFFSEDGQAGTAASSRIRGVVLHDILAHVRVPSDLDEAVGYAVTSGDMTLEEADEARKLLTVRLAEGAAKGWFPENADRILNEVEMIDSHGQIYRPDRVVVEGRKVTVIDYKFGEHHRSYERQISGYADMWRRMGYEDVTAILWYVQTGETMII